jgi:hypothetical protein
MFCRHRGAAVRSAWGRAWAARRTERVPVLKFFGLSLNGHLHLPSGVEQWLPTRQEQAWVGNNLAQGRRRFLRARAQNGTRHSLLSQFNFSFSQPASPYYEECVCVYIYICVGSSMILNRCRYAFVFPCPVTIAVKFCVRFNFIFSLSSTCTCGKAVQTTDHLIFECETLTKEREKLKTTALQKDKWPINKKN